MDNLKLLKSVPPISDKIKKQIDCLYFLKEGYLFKEIKTKTAYCTCCKRRYTTAGLSVDGIMISNSSIINNKKHNDIMYCDCCGSPVTVKDAGRGRSKLKDNLYFGIFQKLRNGCLVLRTFLCQRDYSHNYEKVETTYEEKYCVFFKKGEVISYKKEYWYGWKRLKSVPKLEAIPWGMYQYIAIDYINPDLVSQCKDFKYSMFDEFKKKSPEGFWHKYLELFCKHPILTERLMKEGFLNVIKAICSEKIGDYVNSRADTVKGFLRMNKEEMKLLKELPVSAVKDALRVKSFHLQLNQKTLHYVRSEYYSRNELITFIKNNKLDLDVDRLIMYLIKQDQIATVYMDYIGWVKKYNFELNSKTLLPRYFIKEHDYMMKYNEKMEALKKQKEEKELLENFKNNIFSKLQEVYSYQDKDFVVRPFNDVAEIVKEGQVQNICVGGSNYTNSYMKGKTNLFCLRKVNRPEVPYCTVEVSPKGRLIQSRMKHNQTPPPEVKEFIEKWQQVYTTKNKQYNKKKEVA